MNPEKTRQIRLKETTVKRLDATIRTKQDSYDKLVTYLLDNFPHHRNLKSAYERAIETSEAFKKCPRHNPTVVDQARERAKRANEYLMTIIRNFIKDVEAR